MSAGRFFVEAPAHHRPSTAPLRRYRSAGLKRRLDVEVNLSFIFNLGRAKLRKAKWVTKCEKIVTPTWHNLAFNLRPLSSWELNPVDQSCNADKEFISLMALKWDKFQRQTM